MHIRSVSLAALVFTAAVSGLVLPAHGQETPSDSKWLRSEDVSDAEMQAVAKITAALQKQRQDMRRQNRKKNDNLQGMDSTQVRKTQRTMRKAQLDLQQRLAEKTGMTEERFKKIISSVRRDPALRRRFRSAVKQERQAMMRDKTESKQQRAGSREPGGSATVSLNPAADTVLSQGAGATGTRVNSIEGLSVLETPIVFQDALYFSADDEKTGTELWSYDGDKARQVADINEGPGSSMPTDLTVYDGNLYFSADTGEGKGRYDDRELWVYNGTDVRLVAHINDSEGSAPRELTVYNGALYFQANGGDAGTELWRYDGSAHLAVNVDSSRHGSNPLGLTVYDDGSGKKLYFSADIGAGWNFYAFDGNSLQKIADLSRPVMGAEVYNGALYFSATGLERGRELWRYDGSMELVADINGEDPGYKGVGHSDPRGFVNYNGSLYFQADHERIGEAPWTYDGSTVQLVATLPTGNDNAFDVPITHKGVMYFTAGDKSRDLWSYDGSAVRLIEEGIPGGSPGDFVVYQGVLYFTSAERSNRYLRSYKLGQ